MDYDSGIKKSFLRLYLSTDELKCNYYHHDQIPYDKDLLEILKECGYNLFGTSEKNKSISYRIKYFDVKLLDKFLKEHKKFDIRFKNFDFYDTY